MTTAMTADLVARRRAVEALVRLEVRLEAVA